MFSAQSSLRSALISLSKAQVHQAGQRYTPGVDPAAPNLKIAALTTAIDNAACGAAAQARFRSVIDEFTESWVAAKHSSQHPDEIDTLRAALADCVPEVLGRLRARDASAGKEWAERVSVVESKLLEDALHWRSKEAELDQDDGSYSSARNTIRGHINGLGRCLSVLRDELEYTTGASFQLLSDPLLLIGGEWGTGKTHLLCDITAERLAADAPTLLVLAKNFQGDVLEDIFSQIETDVPIGELFTQLDEAGQGVTGRTLIIVDGVNEGRRLDWRKAMANLMSLISKHRDVGLIISCRTPFESMAIDAADLSRLHRLQHHGFDDQEFDAQASFFHYYQLPLPEVPLLDREFSRPLTLKLICQSLQNLAGNKLAKGFAGIASGQRGMTYVLESFVNRVGVSVEQEFALPAKACWVLLKGADKMPNQRLAGFAPCMAASGRGWVLRREADRIVAASYPALTRGRRLELLETLRTNGLIEEDAIWYSTKTGQHKSRVVYRLPYQRFSDHLIARHLLRAYLDVSSPRAIRRSFTGNSPLARIFELTDQNYGQYAEPGWAQALITEFPERVGRKLPPRQRELFFALPAGARDLNAYFEPFVEGLFWRNPSSFTAGTDAIVRRCLGAGSQAWERVIDALAAVATKPQHPYHAQRLFAYLRRFPMADRDLMWSEYLRRRYASPTVQRLLTWAEKLETVSMTDAVARELAALFSLILTTVVRRDRDLATKALVLIGEKYPKVLFSHAVTCLDFNDPYVPERVLAAAYGVTLSLVDSAVRDSFRPQLGDLAATLYRRLFAPGARFATHHTLMRDFALGVIEVAQQAGCVSLPKTAATHMSRPYANTPSPFAGNGKPDEKVREAIGHAIQMDFGNYTIGGLIPHRSNYDAKHPEYVRVRAKIERRIRDLGYSAERFKQCDAEIGRSSWNARDEAKIDRYGKKYSWIAYFEMWGERDARRKLPDWRQGNRPADCGVDPTFPKRPPAWTPPMPDLFGPPAESTEAWVRGGFTPDWASLLTVQTINGSPGPWVLVEGFVQGSDSENDRDLFAFLRGLLVSEKDVAALSSEFMSIEYPGNHKIPEGVTEHYLFAGEAGHRRNFVRRLLRADGVYRPQVTETFDRYESDYSAAKKVSLSIKVVPGELEDSAMDETNVLEIDMPVTRHIPGVRVELPSVQFGWESYHSVHNTFSGFDMPAPSLIQRLGLSCRNREIDFHDNAGRPATLYREAGEGLTGNQHKLLYIRADLLQRYLDETRQVLVWCNWGERDWMKKLDGFRPIHDEARSRIFQSHLHIHRTFSRWSNG